MEGISDIKIMGIDEMRPPRIRKEPYIDLFFQLSHKAPADWCREFVDSQPNLEYEVKINPEDGLFIQTWVRTPEEIPGHLQTLKGLVAACNARYIENIEASARDQLSDNEMLKNEEGPQGKLNRIVAGLDFSE